MDWNALQDLFCSSSLLKIDFCGLGFLGVGTMLDIFQNIIFIPYFHYGVLVFSGYGVLSLFPLWSLTRIDAQDEKIELLSTQMKELLETVVSMKKVLNELPKSLEKVMSGYQKQQEKPLFPRFGDDGSSFIGTVDDDAFASWKSNYPYLKASILEGGSPRPSCINSWVRTLNPLTCDQAIEFARNMEITTTLNESKSGTRAKSSPLLGRKGYYQTQSWKSIPREIGLRPDKTTQSYLSFKASSKAAQPKQTVVHSNDRPNSTLYSSGTRHLTKQKWEDRRRKGLCFSCGQKYSPQHKCLEGTLRILLLAEVEELDDNGEIRLAEAILDEEEADDMILGIAWLGTLGDVLFNWQIRQVRFWSQGLPPPRSIEHAINLVAGQGPICVRPYRYPLLHKDEIQRQVEEMLRTGVIRVSQRFYQVRVRESDIEKIVFRTHNGHYEFLVMPFGLTNASATFQVLMNDIFRPLLRARVLVFFDDILVYSHTWDQHIKLMTEVLQLLQKHQFVVKKKEDSFGIQSVEYLRHIIDGRGVSMDPAKIESITNWPTPKNVKAVRGKSWLQPLYLHFLISRNPLRSSDTSGRGIEAVLMQSQRPIAYFSKALSDQNLNKSAYEKEIMALVLAIQHWRPYLLGRSFTVFTDQKSLKFLLEQRITTIDQQNWVAKLLGYQFTICYKPGKENRVADALSHIPEVGELYSIVAYPQWLDGTHLLDGLKGDPQLQKIIQELTNDPRSRPGFSLVDGKLYNKERNDEVGARICPRMRHMSKEDISIDFITGLPKLKDYEVILVVVDRILKYCHFIPLKHPFTARSFAEVFLKEVIHLHGIPKSVLSDRDPLFLSTFWKEIFSLQGSKLKFSSAYHPETDGQTKVVNRSLETYLRCFAAEQPKNWSFWLPWAEFWHNTSFHVSMNTNHFEAVYGRAPSTILKYVPGEIYCEAVASDLQDRDEALKQLKYHLARAQERMKKSADKHQREVEFAIGDWVFLKLRPHRQQSIVRRIHQKLAARFYGLFLIIDKIRDVAYKLQLPESARIHPIFHVSLLKQAVGNHPVEPTLPQGLEIDSSTPSLPEKCLAVCEVSKKGEKFLNFRLEDKPTSYEADIDKENDSEQLLDIHARQGTWKVYKRKKFKKGKMSRKANGCYNDERVEE
nr:Ty3/gypsy retrotransposon protein [Tanacetum cinerariifolium]